MSLSFDALARQIKEAAAQQSLQSGQAPGPVTDADWRTLEVAALPEAGPPPGKPRAFLNELSGEAAVRYAYRLVLGREADPNGLEANLHGLAHGLPVLLMAGRLAHSAEGRARSQEPGQHVRGLGLFRRIAALEARAAKWGQSERLIRWAGHLAAFYRRWDAHDLSRQQIREHRALLADWQPLLKRLLGQLGAAQHRLNRLESRLAAREAELKTAIARLNASAAAAQAGGGTVASAPQPSVSAELEAYYLAFENAHRGSPAQLAEQYVAYLPLVEALKSLSHAHPKARALDLGCGRGEWLHFLGQHGLLAWGVDQNAVMLSEAKARGCEVSAMDLITALKAQPDQSLFLVSAFHVAEHLPFEVLYALVGQAHRVLLPGGRLLLETPNPENLLVGAHTFYHDHTHRNPLTPTALSFLLRYWGFEQVDVLRLHPYPESARVPGHDPLTERVNGHLCGPQDFAVLGTR
jgi:O-antigen chain-terminating methyltransferase